MSVRPHAYITASHDLQVVSLQIEPCSSTAKVVCFLGSTMVLRLSWQEKWTWVISSRLTLMLHYKDCDVFECISKDKWDETSVPNILWIGIKRKFDCTDRHWLFWKKHLYWHFISVFVLRIFVMICTGHGKIWRCEIFQGKINKEGASRMTNLQSLARLAICWIQLWII